MALSTLRYQNCISRGGTSRHLIRIMVEYAYLESICDSGESARHLLTQLLNKDVWQEIDVGDTVNVM